MFLRGIRIRMNMVSARQGVRGNSRPARRTILARKEVNCRNKAFMLALGIFHTFRGESFDTIRDRT